MRRRLAAMTGRIRPWREWTLRTRLVAAMVVLTAFAVLGGRALVEERLLAGDPAYRAYRDRVPWRFVPFVL